MKPILFTPASGRQWVKLAAQVRQRIGSRMSEFSASGRGDVKKLKGRQGSRLRVGDWRVIFYEEDGSIIVVAVGHRREIIEASRLSKDSAGTFFLVRIMKFSSPKRLRRMKTRGPRVLLRWVVTRLRQVPRCCRNMWSIVSPKEIIRYGYCVNGATSRRNIFPSRPGLAKAISLILRPDGAMEQRLHFGSLPMCSRYRSIF